MKRSSISRVLGEKGRKDEMVQPNKNKKKEKKKKKKEKLTDSLCWIFKGENTEGIGDWFKLSLTNWDKKKKNKALSDNAK